MNKITVTVSAVGNPDYMYRDYRRSIVIKEKTIPIKSIKKASKVCRDFINKHELGGGNWSGGKIIVNDKQVARVSYNGRIWDMKGNEIK